MLSFCRGRNLFSSLALVLLVVALAALNPSPARAVSYAWNVASGNWDSAGNWTPGGGPPGSAAGDDGTISSNLATANAQLANSANILVNGTGILEINALATSATGGTMTVDSTGRLQWRGTSTGTSAITFNGGATFGKPQLNVIGVSSDDLTIASGTVTASNIAATNSGSTLGLRLDGSLAGGGTTKLLVNPSVGGNTHGSLVLNPSSANTGFTGTAEMQGFSGRRGVLVLSGTGALSNVSAVSFLSDSVLRLSNATDPLPAAFAIDVPSGSRMEWEGSQTYNIAPPTVLLRDGSAFGKNQLNVVGVSTEAITIDSGATVTASEIAATNSGSTLGLRLEGSMTGDGTTKLIVNPSVGGNSHGALVLQPSSANTGFLGAVELTGFSGRSGTMVLSGTGALSNVGSLTLNSGGLLRLRSATDPLPAGFAIDVATGARMEWEGSQTYNIAPPTVLLRDGSTFGKNQLNVIGVSTVAITIDPNATVTASAIAATNGNSVLGLRLEGSLTGDGTTKLIVNPNVGGNSHGSLVLEPAAGNNSGFVGAVELEGFSGRLGTLVLNGTGALSNVGSITLKSGGRLRLKSATDPLPAGFFIDVVNGARMEWEGIQTYNIAPPTITLRDGSTIGRTDGLNIVSTSTEAITIDNGASVTANLIAGTSLNTAFATRLQGPLSGDATSKLIVEQTTAGGNTVAPLELSPTSANPFLGTVEVTGFSATRQAGLILAGTDPLANAKLLDIQAFGTTVVNAAGAADDLDELRVRADGTLRFRNNSGSTLDGTKLTGNGRVRSEIVNGVMLTDQTTRSLTFTNSTVAPGLSAGDLTIEASLTTFDLGSILEIEVGTLDNDTLIVTGDLQLNAGSTLNLKALSDLTTGIYTIGTYSGTLTGEFGTIVDDFGSSFLLGEINYGTLSNSLITVEIFEIPEPSSALLIGLGLLGMSAVRRRRKRTNES